MDDIEKIDGLEKRVASLETGSTASGRRLDELEVNALTSEQSSVERHNLLESRMGVVEGRQGRIEAMFLKIQLSLADGTRVTAKLHAELQSELQSGMSEIIERLDRLEKKK